MKERNKLEENVKVDDIVKIMDGQFDMSDYLNEIRNTINKVTEERLLNKFKQTVDVYKEKSVEKSKKEMNLLNAIKPFIPENNRGNIEQFTEMISNFKAIDELVKDVKQVKTMQHENKTENENEKKSTTSKEDIFIEEDNTIYEIDKKCQGRVKSTSTSSNYLPLILIMLFFTGDTLF